MLLSVVHSPHQSLHKPYSKLSKQASRPVSPVLEFSFGVIILITNLTSNSNFFYISNRSFPRQNLVVLLSAALAVCSDPHKKWRKDRRESSCMLTLFKEMISEVSCVEVLSSGITVLKRSGIPPVLSLLFRFRFTKSRILLTLYKWLLKVDIESRK